MYLNKTNSLQFAAILAEPPSGSVMRRQNFGLLFPLLLKIPILFLTETKNARKTEVIRRQKLSSDQCQ
jgi:hypothetical protein